MSTELAITPDIPRQFTAVAEWGACVVYIAILARRGRWLLTALIGIAGLTALLAVQTWAGSLPIALWIPAMLLAATCMLLLLLATLEVSVGGAIYLAARAFVLAELVASLHWQLDRFYATEASLSTRIVFLIVVYGALLVVGWFVERRHFPRDQSLEVGVGEIIGALAIAAATFGISNLSFIIATSPFSGRAVRELLYIRTLVDLSGYIALYVQHEVRRGLQNRRDAEATAALLRGQHDQYEITRRAIDEVNRKYHDMKHHIDALRAASAPDVRARVLDDLEGSIREYDLQVRTGDRVLDAVLTGKRMLAHEYGVDLKYVVDGRLLDFMQPLDITGIFGNALDNALEASRSSPRDEARTVQLVLFEKDDFVMIQVRNGFDGVLRRERGRIVSRQTDAGHGYGLRNIESAAEKYGGSMVAQVNGHNFLLRILIPRPR